MFKHTEMGPGAPGKAEKPTMNKTMDSRVLLQQEQESFDRLEELGQLLHALVSDLPADFKEKHPMQYKRINYSAAKIIQRASVLGSILGTGGVIAGVAEMNAATVLEGAAFGVSAWLAGFLHERPMLRSADEVHHWNEGPASESLSRKEPRFNTDPNKW